MKFYGSLAFSFLLVLSTLAGFSAQAQDSETVFTPDDRPRLVVGIVVDQMRYEYLTKYWDRYGEDGFKRLVNEGYNFANNHFNYFPTYTGPGHAAVYTGTTPSINGIVGNDWYSRELGRTLYVVEDSTVSGVGAEGEVGQMSPKNLLSTTIADELKSANKHSKVVTVSIKDRGAVLAAGHVGDMAFWYDDQQGSFVSSSWYLDALPKWVRQFNAAGLAREYSSRTWETLLPLKEYTESNEDNTPYEQPFPWEDEPVFPHELSQYEGDEYWNIKATPYGNTLVKEFALSAVKNENLGQDSDTDLLGISFSSTDYVGHQFGPNSIELADTYLRLDRDLADLFTKLDKQVGKGQYLVFLTSDHGVVDVPAELMDRGLPGGYFDAETAIGSLKAHLEELYGEGEWIEAIANQQIYLNRELLAEEDISIEEMQYETAQFLLQFDGVLSTNTAYNYKNENYTHGQQAMYQRGFMYDRSGDVFVQLKSGWLVDSGRRTGTTHGSPYNYDTHIPMLMYGWGIPQGITNKKTAVTQLAPTLSVLLNISFPSGSSAKPLIFE